MKILQFEALFMKKLSNTVAKLKKALLIKKACTWTPVLVLKEAILFYYVFK